MTKAPGRWPEDVLTPRVGPIVPEEGVDDEGGLGQARWPVERTLSWRHQHRRLRMSYERRPEIHHVFLTLAFIKISMIG